MPKSPRRRHNNFAVARRREAQSFERGLALPREYDRGGGPRLTKWSFDDAFRALAHELEKFGFRLPADNDEEEDKGAASG